MNINMAQHFSTWQLVRYSLPSIAMMFFTSIYGIVDGVFVANFIGTSTFAAVNIILPYVMVLSVTGFMIGTGGSALVSTIRGEGDEVRANQVFTLLVLFAFLLGCALAVVGWFTVRPVANALGATAPLADICETYGRVLMLSLPFFTLQYVFQAFFSAAGKPTLGFAVIVAAGVTNIVLDAVFIVCLGWGIVGAGAATVIGEIIGGGAPLIYFARKNNSFLRLGRVSFDWHPIGKACLNGSSEMVSNVAASLISMLYNFQLMRFIGENGVAAFGVVYYTYLVFFPLFIGYNIATSPLLSYQYGAQNHTEMRSILLKSLRYTAVASVLMFACAQLLAASIAWLFSAGNTELLKLTITAFSTLSFAFLFAGFCMYGSAFFTALNNGVVSAALSFVQTLGFEVVAVLALPTLFGINGIWASWPLASLLGCLLAFALLKAFAKRYGYGK